MNVGDAIGGLDPYRNPFGMGGPIFPGSIDRGNIDVNNRPIVHNPDGSISTVRSISVADDSGNTFLIPTVSEDGRIMPNTEAIGQFQRTGRHLGVFDNEAHAQMYADWLHQQQAARYVAEPMIRPQRLVS